MTGQHVRSSTDLLGQCSILTGHCPLTSRYFKPCYVNIDLRHQYGISVLQRRWARRNVCCSQAKMTFKEQLQKFHTDDVPLHIPGGCFWLVEANVPIRKPMTGTTQISVMIHHQCGISALVPQTSFHEETSGGIANAQCLRALKGLVAKLSHTLFSRMVICPSNLVFE